MNEFGYISLSLAWLFSLFGMVVGFFAAYKKNLTLTKVARQKVIAVGLATLSALITLALLFLTDDYSNQYVWQTSNKDMPWAYKITAIWGGMDGSMLLWAGMLSVSSAIVALRFSSYPVALMAWVLPVLHSTLLFFLTLLVFFTNPFRYIRADFIPPEGNGLNPLLQNPYMAVHPPMLYLGFTTFAIPFAFCLAALLAKRLDNEWIHLTRRWTLIAWGFLTAGIVLGGHWAYLELGWGGFWAWDPVENASFLPWLTGTAFLHSVMIQERKGMLKVWNVWLIIVTYGLTVFGTFLTRSGIVQSVHAFASTDIGFVFIDYLVALFCVTLLLTFLRRKELRAERVFESVLSRESAFLLNNLVFLSICFATLWGVMFPVFSEAFTGVKQTVGIPYFNAINVPLFLFLIFLMGVGPLLAWRKAQVSQLVKSFLWPFVFAFLLGALIVFAGGLKFYPTLSYSLCAFVIFTLLGEFHRTYKTHKQKDSSVLHVVNRHRRRYGGYLVHIGVVVMTISITASMAHKYEEEFMLAPGEKKQIGRFEVSLDNMREVQTKNYSALVGDVSLFAAGRLLTTLHPEIRRYIRSSETTTEVALRMGAREDFYLVLAGTDNQGVRAAFKVFINPLQIWLWVGTLVVLLGTGVVLLPRYKKRVS